MSGGIVSVRALRTPSRNVDSRTCRSWLCFATALRDPLCTVVASPVVGAVCAAVGTVPGASVLVGTYAAAVVGAALGAPVVTGVRAVLCTEPAAFVAARGAVV